MFLFTQGFHSQNVLISFLFSMEYSFLLTEKITSDHVLTLNDFFEFLHAVQRAWSIGDKECFNTSLEEQKVIYTDETSH